MDESNGVPKDEPQAATGNSRKRGARTEPPQTETPAPADAALTVGEELRQSREAAGLALGDVAERTKIRPGILTDIEADAHDKLPALTYSLGFVKAYARTVGLDPVVVAERYRRESQKGDPVSTMVDLQPLEERRLPSRRIVLGSALVLLLLLAAFWAWGAGWLSPALPVSPQPAVIEETALEPGSVEVTPAVPAVNPTAAVTVKAREEVWLRIADGDEAFFMGTMTAGQSMTLPPGRDWTLRTGRAGALDLTVGDTPIAALGGGADQVRNLSLKPEDLLGNAAAPTGGLAPATPVQGQAPTPGIAPPQA